MAQITFDIDPDDLGIIRVSLQEEAKAQQASITKAQQHRAEHLRAGHDPDAIIAQNQRWLDVIGVVTDQIIEQENVLRWPELFCNSAGASHE